MAYIYLRGINDPIEINNADALQAKARWETCHATRKHEPIDVGSMTILTSEIKTIKLDTEERDDNINKMVEKVKESRRKMLALPPEARANSNLPHFMLALKVFCGKKEITADQEKYILDRMTKFFEKNPKWITPSLKVYKPIFEKIGELEHADKMVDGGSRALERAEQNEYIFNNFQVKV